MIEALNGCAAPQPCRLRVGGQFVLLRTRVKGLCAPALAFPATAP